MRRATVRLLPLALGLAPGPRAREAYIIRGVGVVLGLILIYLYTLLIFNKKNKTFTLFLPVPRVENK